MAERKDERPGEIDDAGPVTEAAESMEDDQAAPGTSAPSVAFRGGS